MIFTTLSNVKAGDCIIWNISPQEDKYDVLYRDYNGRLEWCGAHYDKITKTCSLDRGRDTGTPIPLSLEDATEYLEAVKKQWPGAMYKLHKLNIITVLCFSDVREVEEDDDDVINVYATIKSKDLIDNTYKKYIGKAEDSVVILDKL